MWPLRWDVFGEATGEGDGGGGCCRADRFRTVVCIRVLPTSADILFELFGRSVAWGGCGRLLRKCWGKTSLRVVCAPFFLEGKEKCGDFNGGRLPNIVTRESRRRCSLRGVL